MKNAYKVRTITCVSCGKTVTKRMPEGRNYCSIECYRNSPHPQRKTGKNVKCETCGKEFYAPGARIAANARFCSNECANEWQGRNKTEHECIICGKTFRWSPSRSASGKYNIKYCSLECRDKDPERRKLLARMNAKQQGVSPNKLEVTGYEILDSIGVEYFKQHVIADKFCVDAFVPSASIVVQFDGDYWHGNASYFPEPSERQRKRMRLDKSQDAYMTECGYHVVRIWESDIRKRKDHVIETLQLLLTHP